LQDFILTISERSDSGEKKRGDPLDGRGFGDDGPLEDLFGAGTHDGWNDLLVVRAAPLPRWHSHNKVDMGETRR